MASIKKLLCTTLLLLSVVTLPAQNSDEWMRQKKTQRKYLIQQIIALQVYLGRLKKGYEIVRKGWNTVEKITDGEFNLHRDFLGSLQSAGPIVRNDYRVSAVLKWPSRINAWQKAVEQKLREEETLRNSETDYVEQIHEALLDEAYRLLKQLSATLADDDLEMNDAQRLEELEKINGDMQSLYRTSVHFGKQLLSLSAERLQQQNNLELLEYHYDE